MAVTEQQVDANIREAFSADSGDRRAVERALKQAEIRERVHTALIEEQAAKWLVDHASPAGESSASESESPKDPESESPAPALQEQHP